MRTNSWSFSGTLLVATITAALSGLGAKPAPRPLTPPPKSFQMYAKISGLWQGNKILYCNSDKAIRQTLREIKQLHDVRTAKYDAYTDEIKIEDKTGGRGAIDVDNVPRHKKGELCVN